MNQDAAPSFRNQLLAGLPDEEIQHLKTFLQPTSFVLQQVLHEAGNPIEYVYFPESGLISVTADTHDNGMVEVGLTGREGFTGTPVLLDADANAVHRSFSQVPGSAYGIGAQNLREAVRDLPVLRERCLRYIHFFMVQTAQCVACNARHELPERLARWLLMSHDRVEGTDLPMKQEFLSFMLGVRRAGVSTVVGTLQSAGLIQTSRGHVTIIDRDRLEQEACSCYQIIEDSRRMILRAD
jgi:CRP-like cAMP-binding protein